MAELSPQAQAVLDAAMDYTPTMIDARLGAAAALRAAADQVIGERCQNESERRIFDRLRRIAAELEGADG